MGGLRISDFADPDHGRAENGSGSDCGVFGETSPPRTAHVNFDEDNEELEQRDGSSESLGEDEEEELITSRADHESDLSTDEEHMEIEARLDVQVNVDAMKDADEVENNNGDIQKLEIPAVSEPVDGASHSQSQSTRDESDDKDQVVSMLRDGRVVANEVDTHGFPGSSMTLSGTLEDAGRIESEESPEQESVIAASDVVVDLDLVMPVGAEVIECSAGVIQDVLIETSVDAVDSELQESTGSGEDAAPNGLGHSSSSSSSSRDSLDSPMPLVRAGPVIIPQIPSHLRSIRAGSDSPFRDLPTPSRMAFISFDPSPDHAENAQSSTPSSIRASDGAILMQTPGALSTPVSHETRHPASVGASSNALRLQSNDTGAQLGTSSMVQSSLSPGSQITASVDRTAALPQSTRKEQKAAARRQAIHERLDAAASITKMSVLGPPQRTVSRSSSAIAGSSSSSRSSQLPNQGRPPSRLGSTSNAPKEPSRSLVGPSSSSTGMIRPKDKVLAAKPGAARIRPSIAGPNFAQPTLASSRAAANKAMPSQSSMKPTSILKPTLIKATTTVPRQPLANRAVPQPTARPSSAIGMQKVPRQIPSKPAVPVYHSAPTRSTMPPPEPVMSAPNPLKRPYPIAQSTLGKSIAASTNGRPTLGLPARLVRQGPPGSVPVFSVGVSGPELGASALAVSRPGYRSPATFGHVQRPYGSPRLPERKVSYIEDLVSKLC